MIRWTDVKLQLAVDGKRTGKIQVELLAYDRDGHALNWQGGTLAMNLAPDVYAAIQRSGVPAHFEIDVPSDKDVFLATGVYDWQSGKAGTLEIPFTLGSDCGIEESLVSCPRSSLKNLFCSCIRARLQSCRKACRMIGAFIAPEGRSSIPQLFNELRGHDARTGCINAVLKGHGFRRAIKAA